MNVADAPRPDPVAIAADTWLIPNLAAAEPGTYVGVNSLLVRGDEPIIIDTGAPLHRERWLEQVFALVEPEDVRWIFLSHDDGDHTGALLDVIDRCPAATLVTNFFAVEWLALEKPALPLHRMRWLEPGDTFDIGDRRMRLVLPPIFDGPTTRGLFDERTGVLWAVDSVAALRPDVVASAHGPVLTGTAIPDAFDRVRALAGQPRIMPPGQAALDEMIAAATAVAPAA